MPDENTQEEAQQDNIGALDPSIWDEAPAVAGRPADEVPENSTLASRAKAASSAETKSVAKAEAEDKAVRSSRKKSAE